MLSFYTTDPKKFFEITKEKLKSHGASEEEIQDIFNDMDVRPYPPGYPDVGQYD